MYFSMKYSLIFTSLVFISLLFGCAQIQQTEKNTEISTNPPIEQWVYEIPEDSSFHHPQIPRYEKTGKETIHYNLDWKDKVFNFGGKEVIFKFWEWNPKETDKTLRELIEIDKYCNDTENFFNCWWEKASNTLTIFAWKNDTEYAVKKYPYRVTPGIEKKIYDFLADSLIFKSTEKCGKYFYSWKEANENTIFGRHIQDELIYWWNPYYIDIEDYILVNPYTGRKEVNLRFLWSFRMQITPAEDLVESSPNENAINPALQKCLKEHWILKELQKLLEKNIHMYRNLNQWWNMFL